MKKSTIMGVCGLIIMFWPLTVPLVMLAWAHPKEFIAASSIILGVCLSFFIGIYLMNRAIDLESRGE